MISKVYLICLFIVLSFEHKWDPPREGYEWRLIVKEQYQVREWRKDSIFMLKVIGRKDLKRELTCTTYEFLNVVSADYSENKIIVARENGINSSNYIFEYLSMEGCFNKFYKGWISVSEPKFDASRLKQG